MAHQPSGARPERERGGPRRPETPEEPDALLYTSEPVEADDGTTYVIRQQNVGPDNELGGGEWPDPDTPPTRSPREDPAG